MTDWEGCSLKHRKGIAEADRSVVHGPDFQGHYAFGCPTRPVHDSVPEGIVTVVVGGGQVMEAASGLSTKLAGVCRPGHELEKRARRQSSSESLPLTESLSAWSSSNDQKSALATG